MGKVSVARKAPTPAAWSDGDVYIIIAAVNQHFARTGRFDRVISGWVRAMNAGRGQSAARTELRAAAIAVCERAKRLRPAVA